MKEIIDNSARQQNKLTNDMNDRKYTNISQTVHEVVTTLTTSQSYDNRKPLLLICGSAFIMAEARSALGIIEPRDGDILATTLGNSYIDSQVSRNIDAFFIEVLIDFSLIGTFY